MSLLTGDDGLMAARAAAETFNYLAQSSDSVAGAIVRGGAVKLLLNYINDVSHKVFGVMKSMRGKIQGSIGREIEGIASRVVGKVEATVKKSMEVGMKVGMFVAEGQHGASRVAVAEKRIKETQKMGSAAASNALLELVKSAGLDERLLILLC